jgi:hypothetical protein
MTVRSSPGDGTAPSAHDDVRADFDAARAVADAVLYEGYLLYPYRASSRKNQVRWQFGVVGPEAAHLAGVGEEPEMRTECLLQAGDGARVDVRVRSLQLQSRIVEEAVDGAFLPVPELRAGERTWLSWDEAVEVQADVSDLSIGDLLCGGPQTVPVEVAGGVDIEMLYDAAGAVLGRLRRQRWPISGTLEIGATRVTGTGYLTVRVRLRNTGDFPGERHGSGRDGALQQSFIGAHLILAVRHGSFLSLFVPPDDARAAAAACDNYRCWPVLVGAEGEHATVLASPIILYDWPAIADESAGELFDSTEIDEILTLRVMTLTDEEKREARATDPRAGAILDRCDDMPLEVFERLHGATRQLSPEPFPARAGWQPQPPAMPPAQDEDIPTFSTGEVPWWDPAADASVSPSTDSIEVHGVAVAKGSRVRLHPGRRADAQDLFFADQAATVAGVHHDVDGEVHVAVVLEADPASDLHEWYGRFLYFGPEELEPLAALASTSEPDPPEVAP